MKEINNERIKNVRLSAGLTQLEFAQKIGVSRSTIINWQYNQNGPVPAMLQKIARQFNVNPLYLSGQSDMMFIPPDEDEEIIDRALENADPLLKSLLIGIVKKPDGWRMLAESILTAADTLREAGYELDEKKPGE